MTCQVLNPPIETKLYQGIVYSIAVTLDCYPPICQFIMNLDKDVTNEIVEWSNLKDMKIGEIFNFAHQYAQRKIDKLL